jgi:hypothetical protein
MTPAPPTTPRQLALDGPVHSDAALVQAIDKAVRVAGGIR